MNWSRLRVVLLFVPCLLADARRTEEMTLLEVQQALVAKRLVDLTHAFSPGIPHWPGFPDEKRDLIYWFERGRGSMGAGFFAETFTHVGQWGTHVDPPAHSRGSSCGWFNSRSENAHRMIWKEDGFLTVPALRWQLNIRLVDNETITQLAAFARRL